MKKEKVEELLGRQVMVTLFDNSVYIGELHKAGEELFKNDPNLYIPGNYYFLINPQSVLFRSSHIKKIRLTLMNGLKKPHSSRN